MEEAEIDERIRQLQKLFGEGEKAEERFLSGITDIKEFQKKYHKQIRIDKYMDSLLKEPVISDEEISAYYNDNLDRLKEEEMVEIQQVTWRLPPAPTAVLLKNLPKRLHKRKKSLVKPSPAGILPSWSKYIPLTPKYQKMTELLDGSRKNS